MKARGQGWTVDEIAQLRAMRECGESFEDIAQAVGHPLSSCHWKASTLGIMKPRKDSYTRQRFLQECRTPASEARSLAKSGSDPIPCLNCRRLFRSTGSGNRLCPRCRSESLSPFDVPARIGQ